MRRLTMAFILTTMVLFSCDLNDTPEFELYVSRIESGLYQQVEMQIISIRMIDTNGTASTIPMYGETTHTFETIEEPKFIYEGMIIENELDSFGIGIGYIRATTKEGEVVNVLELSNNYDHRIDYEFLSGNRYRIDIIYDFDTSIGIDEPITFQSIAEIKIEQI